LEILSTNDNKLLNTIYTLKNLSLVHQKLTVIVYNQFRDKETTYSRQQLKSKHNITFNELKSMLDIELSSNIYNNNFKVMLEDTKETYYWAGFLFADGSITRDYKSLNMRLGQLDMEHTIKFRKYINYSGIQTGRDISVSSNFIEPFSKKFGIIPDKSHSELDYTFYKNLPYDLWVSWLIGYTDGDGSICSRKDRKNLFNIRYVAHISNLSFHRQLLDDIKNRIDFCNSEIYYDGDTILRWRIAKKSIINELKNQSISLPVLNRKWDKIPIV
jgi:tetrahydromethanopterin S-methyltransferase subunit G